MQQLCCSCAAQGNGKRGRSGIEMLELQVCCGAELCDIFMLMQCVCRCVGDVWWLRELAWAWKALQIHQFPSKRRLSSTYAVVLTVEPLCRQSALMIKGVIWLCSTWKFCIFGLLPSRGMMSSRISCGLFVAHISGLQLAGLGVFANFSTHLLSWDWKSSFPLLLLVGSSNKIW